MLSAGTAFAAVASADAPHLDGAALGLLWGLPFAGILLSIALFPLFAPHFWEHHFGKVSAFWGLAFLVPFALMFGVELTLYSVLHTALLEYIPFIILLFALFTVAGGISLKGTLPGTPLANTVMMAIGTGIASWMGTTGASMLLIRPILQANLWRKKVVHIVVFFIFLVSNIGGSLTPLGDPPLFLGFLKGVEFFWTTTHLFAETVTLALPLLALFFLIDSYYYRKEADVPAPPALKGHLGVEGLVNVVLLAAIVGAVLMSGIWEPGISFSVYHNEIPLQNLVRDVLLVAIALLSLRLTPKTAHESNAFSWGPMLEVAKLFASIFLTIVPVIAILRAGPDGALRSVVALVTDASGAPNNAMYFWLTGALSSFLDNAPTYLVFFNLAGGEANRLMYELPLTLAAISAGAVFMGANTYIGNAPNFMVKAIAESRGVKMPSFFGYMAWSVGVLIPLFLICTVLFFS
ncbi:MAG TPA: sodium:proton antiporter [Alphaproteobacteria bacterium]|nr:sodium:proton antiporter [Alphaproteobacteria bacterium]